MINSLIKLANKFSAEGKSVKAKRISDYILKCADDNEEPSPEDLLNEESWLADEGINPYELTDDNVMSDLGDEDAQVTERYLDSEGKIEELLEQLRELQTQELGTGVTQDQIIDELSTILLSRIGRGEHSSRMSDLPHQLEYKDQMVGQAAVKNVLKMANALDSQGCFKHADFLDKIAYKLASFDDDDDGFGDDLYLDSDDDAPTDDDLLELEDDSEDIFYSLLTLAEKLSKGSFMNLQAAQAEATALLAKYDADLNTYDEGPEKEVNSFTPDNVLSFPKDM